ncbi:hypothetical protein PENCOP_c005G01674 [Penicillium coprophilum]|uniref:Alcohol dehydrogenase-like C-terminal domain-containing protein n=1 Tax=Penicillium coprophilum TaxID=36646 RepID=A0A1V6URL3_9EURO|nr:hypothetical protein PENCOP_c005G01674 [Penicillium coprophilum]
MPGSHNAIFLQPHIVQGVNGPITSPATPGCDRILTHVAPKLVESHEDDAFAGVANTISCLGLGSDGTLRSHGIFSEAGFVHAPKSLDWLPAATLTCTWTTAWNALFGLKDREAGPDLWVLVQGTGGVSMAALQLAVAVGASVIVTTSSDEKGARLKTLDATHVLNYQTHPETWGEDARALTPTPGGKGVDVVIDVGGNEILPESLAAVRVDGIVLVID